MRRSKLRQIKKNVKKGGSLYWKRQYWKARREEVEEPPISEPDYEDYDDLLTDPEGDWLKEVEDYFPIDWYDFNAVRRWRRGNDSSDKENIMMATFGEQDSWRQLKFDTVKSLVEENGLWYEYHDGHTIIEMLADAGIVVEGY